MDILVFLINDDAYSISSQGKFLFFPNNNLSYKKLLLGAPGWLRLQLTGGCKGYLRITVTKGMKPI